MLNTLRLMVLFSIALIIPVNAIAANDWKLSKEDDGIKVFVRNTVGSPVKSFKAQMIMPTRLTALIALLDDTQAYPRWLHNCKSATSLKAMGNHQHLNYVVTRMPWPVASRDSVIHSFQTQDKKTKRIIIELSSQPEMVARKNGFVRIQTLQGRWVFTPTKGKVQIVYEMSVDPGGNIPKWLVNAMAVDLPFYTLRKLRQVVKEDKYQNAKLSYIVD